jgi:hypothetical protein
MPFAALNADEQDALLRKIEDTPVFSALAEYITAAYWSTPAGQSAAGFEVRG